MNQSVYRFTAIHSSHSPLFYQLEDSDYFAIDSQSGLLTLTHRLDKELVDKQLKFIVKACSVRTSDCAKTQVHIDLMDLNDNWPVFEKDQYQGLIREDSLPGTVILTTTAHDADFNKKIFVKDLEYSQLVNDYRWHNQHLKI